MQNDEGTKTKIRGSLQMELTNRRKLRMQKTQKKRGKAFQKSESVRKLLRRRIRGKTKGLGTPLKQCTHVSGPVQEEHVSQKSFRHFPLSRPLRASEPSSIRYHNFQKAHRNLFAIPRSLPTRSRAMSAQNHSSQWQASTQSV